MEELFNNIGQVGFPILVSMYLLTRFEAKLEQLDNSIVSLKSVIDSKF